MNENPPHVCPVELAGSLDSRWRRWIQNPTKILGPYVHEGMTAMDFGCGPGFFTLDMAHLVGSTGRVVAADTQEGMLDLVREKVRGTTLEPCIFLHHCPPDKIGYPSPVDFILAFYVVHELPDQDAFFAECHTMLRPGGRLLIVEPPLHVSRSAFQFSLNRAQAAGLAIDRGPSMLLHKTAILTKPAGNFR